MLGFLSVSSALDVAGRVWGESGGKEFRGAGSGWGRDAMMASSHIIVGAATWTWLASRFGLPPLDPLGIGLAALGALAPDIDHPKSTLGSRLKPISVPISLVFGHRGITHSLFAVAACAWLFAHSGVDAGLSAPFLVGYLTHLAGDLLSPSGLPLLYPLKRRRTFALPIIKTGGFSEQLVVVLLCGWLISSLFGCDWRGVMDTPAWRSAAALWAEAGDRLSGLRPAGEGSGVSEWPPRKPQGKPTVKPPHPMASAACGLCG